MTLKGEMALILRYFTEFGSFKNAAWRSGNGVGRINEVTLRRARLVLGWVTCPGSTPGGSTLFRYVTNHPCQLSLSSFWGR